MSRPDGESDLLGRVNSAIANLKAAEGTDRWPRALEAAEKTYKQVAQLVKPAAYRHRDTKAALKRLVALLERENPGFGVIDLDEVEEEKVAAGPPPVAEELVEEKKTSQPLPPDRSPGGPIADWDQLTGHLIGGTGSGPQESEPQDKYVDSDDLAAALRKPGTWSGSEADRQQKEREQAEHLKSQLADTGEQFSAAQRRLQALWRDNADCRLAQGAPALTADDIIRITDTTRAIIVKQTKSASPTQHELPHRLPGLLRAAHDNGYNIRDARVQEEIGWMAMYVVTATTTSLMGSRLGTI